MPAKKWSCIELQQQRVLLLALGVHSFDRPAAAGSNHLCSSRCARGCWRHCPCRFCLGELCGAAIDFCSSVPGWWFLNRHPMLRLATCLIAAAVRAATMLLFGSRPPSTSSGAAFAIRASAQRTPPLIPTMAPDFQKSKHTRALTERPTHQTW